MIAILARNAHAATAPAEIVFLPEGRHKLTPKSHPKGIDVNVPADRGEAIAAAFNRDLAKRGNVRGWLDFEHSRKHPASGYPTSFRYQPGEGIMASIEWSASGRAAVEGRDVMYFSPEFYVDRDGVPTNLPDRGPIGGLVTEPAFREMRRIAASEADAGELSVMERLCAAFAEQAEDLERSERERVAASDDAKLWEPYTEEDGRPYQRKMSIQDQLAAAFAEEFA